MRSFKFSANPGRFTLAEIQVDDNKMEFTDIRAEFEWGVESIEVIKNVTHRWFESLSDDDRKHFEVIFSRFLNLSIISVFFVII